MAVKRDRLAVFQPEFREDLRYWVATDRRVALRALEIVEAVIRDPFTGIGKPEPLKYLASGTWSRRLTQEHRIVYLVSDDGSEIARQPFTAASAEPLIGRNLLLVKSPERYPELERAARRRAR